MRDAGYKKLTKGGIGDKNTMTEAEEGTLGRWNEFRKAKDQASPVTTTIFS